MEVRRPIKVLQFGGGNFLRAFADKMIDVLNEETDFNGDVLVVKPTEKGTYKKLRKQKGQFHVLLNGIENGEVVEELHRIKCIQSILHSYLEWEAFLKTAENPAIKIILSNTTEAGIVFNEKDEFSLSKTPSEFPAKLAIWLYCRYKAFQGASEKGCIALPCELIEDNGNQLKTCILKYAELWKLEAGFSNWIQEHNYFYNTLVDQIVSGFPKDKATDIEERLGQKDELLVEAELYHQWVIEAPPAILKELPFDQTNLNVTLTNDLKPYRDLKVSILNGAHTSMVPIGYLHGLITVRETIEDPKIGAFIKDLIYEEVLPTLDFPKDHLEKYAEATFDRFKNPFLKHYLIDIALNSISKFKTRLLPNLLKYYEKKGQIPDRIVESLAYLILLYKGEYKSEKIPLRDDAATLKFFKENWGKYSNSKISLDEFITTILQEKSFWGIDLTQLPNLENHLKTTLINQLTNNE